jgi:hypothetical protein
VGRTREAAEEQQGVAEEALLAAIALLLMGQAKPPSGTPLVAAIASLLLALVPRADVAASEATAVSRLVLRDLPRVPKGADAILAASRGEFSMRAAYGMAALGRVREAVQEGSGLEDALRDEARYFAAHREASKQRRAGLNLNLAAAERYGPVLSWNHRPKPGETRRPSHEAAEGHNFDVRLGVPASTGSLPGFEPNCHCFAGPPIPGARMLN